MKNILYKFLFTFLLIFSYIFVSASEVNPSYKEFLKLSDSVKSGIGLVPSEYINYYEVNNKISRNNGLTLYGDSISSYDLRNVDGKRLIPEVKNQNPLNLCWAFATNNMIESYFIRKGKEYNLSENHLDYVSRYYKDTTTFGQSNSYFNVIKYLLYGYGPFSEDIFGSYFTSYKSLNYDTYLDYDNTLFDINELVVFPSLKMQYLKDNFPAASIKYYVEDYNKKMKEHIMNYGAIASGIYWDFYDEEKNLIYNDGSLTESEYLPSGHAITIIGWDDNYGTVNINGTNFTGSWLAMNSWGNYIDYFYISYYDENVVQSLLGIKNITEKEWDNVYFDKNVVESSAKKHVYEFTKDNINESINSVKVFHYDNDDVFTVKISDGYKTYTSSSNSSVTFGIKTFEFDDVSFDGNKVYVTIESSKGTTQFDVALYTSNSTNNKGIDIVENDSSMYGGTINHSILSRGINTGTKYSVKIYDQNNKDISSSFLINESMVINDVSKLNIVIKGDISYSNFIKIVVSSGSYSDNIILYRTPSGTKSDPFIIRTSSEMGYLSKNYYFELGNNIDMKYETTNIYGDFYNSGNGWKSFNLNGHLDGKGYKVKNLYSKNGSLFGTVSNSSIKNIAFDNFDISDINSNESYTGLFNNLSNSSVISNVLINNIKLNCSKTKCGVLVGNMLDGNISNIHVMNSNISGSNGAYLVSNINNPTNQINISSVFVNDSVLGNNNYLIGSININNKVSELKKINISNNIVNGNDSSNTLIGSKNITISDDSSYDIYKEKLILSGNYIKNDNDVLIEDNFVNYDKSIWSFDGIKSLYLIMFEDMYFTGEDDRLIVLKNYLIDNDVILGIGTNTSVNSFLSNITNRDNFDINVYSNSGKIITGNNLVTTGSYIDVSLNNNSQRYYIVVNGDVNSDGILSIFDIVKINNHIVYNDKKLLGIYTLAADYNDDEIISIFDIVKINNKILGGN